MWLEILTENTNLIGVGPPSIAGHVLQSYTGLVIRHADLDGPVCGLDIRPASVVIDIELYC